MAILYYSLLTIEILTGLFFLAFFIAQIIAQLTVDAPYVPVPDQVKKVLLETLGTLDLKSNSVLYDLGCGDGRVLNWIAEKYSETKLVGIEKAVYPYLLAKFKTWHNPRITIIRGDIFTSDLSTATHIFVYLFPSVLDRLWPKLQAECQAGVSVLSCDFSTKLASPAKEILIENRDNYPRGKRLLVYRR